MTGKKIITTLSGHKVLFLLQFGGTERLFGSYAGPADREREEVPVRAPELWVPAEKILEHASEAGLPPEHAEFDYLARAAGIWLSARGTAMFHGVAMIRDGGAFLLTAPSGTGKSTQFRNLRRLYGDRYRIINGDKPLLRLEGNGEVTVCPSPWNGKEGWGGKEEAPLKGLYLLKQGGENMIRRLPSEESLIFVLSQFLYTDATEAGIHTMCRIADAMLTRVPVFSFVNRGDPASSAMLDRHIGREEADKDEIQT